MLPAVFTLTWAVVVSDQSVLKAAPHETAPRQATLWRGDGLEVRGAQKGYVQVYDHRHERPGYIRPTEVRSYDIEGPEAARETTAARTRAIIDFLRDTPGAESLLIGYVALYLRVAPPAAIDAALFDALGTAAERLGQRASRRVAKPSEPLAEHLEVARSYGVQFVSFERGGSEQLCYDGEAFRRVLALPADAALRTRSVLALTDPSCVDPALGPSARQTLIAWQDERLGELDLTQLGADLKNRVHLRRAAIKAELAYAESRTHEPRRAEAASAEAVTELALVDRSQLADEELVPYEETAIRVGAARWPSEAPRPLGGPYLIRTRPGQPGETCIALTARAAPKQVLLEKCTYGLVWEASARSAPHERGVALVVQPLAGWTELWLFGKHDGEWRVDTLLPAVAEPELGYVELAGFTPDGSRLLVVREAKRKAALEKHFQVLRTDTLTVELDARSLDRFPTFRRYYAADWKGRTLALR